MPSHFLPTANPLRAIAESVEELDGDSILRHRHPKGIYTCAAFSADLAFLGLGSNDHTVRLIDAHDVSGGPVARLKGHSGGVTAIAFSPDGSWLASASRDATVCLCNVAQAVCVPGAVSQPHQLQQQQRSRALSATAAAAGGVLQPQPQQQQPQQQRARAVSDASCVSLTSSSAGGGNGSRQGTCVPIVLSRHSGPVYCLAFSPDGGTLMTGSEDRTVCVWELSSDPGCRPALRAVLGHSHIVFSAAISAANASLAVTAAADHSLRVWDLHKRQCLRTLVSHQDRVTCTAVSADGLYAVSGSLDGCVKVWRLDTYEEVHSLCAAEQTGAVACVALTPDGRWAVAAGEDAQIRVWDLDSGECVASTPGHQEYVQSVAISADGRRVASTSGDRTARLWTLRVAADGSTAMLVPAETVQRSSRLRSRTSSVRSEA